MTFTNDLTVIEISALDLPTRVVYFSNISENTLRFVRKLRLPTKRIPVLPSEPFLEVNEDFILITPTYGAGRIKGSVPKQVLRFFNESESNRKHCKGVVVSGNTTFGMGYASAGTIIAEKLEIPVIHIFEVLGTVDDVETVREAIFELFPEQKELEHATAASFPIEGKFH